MSLCLVGSAQVPSHVEHVADRLIDTPDPEANPNLDFVLVDAARTLREEGHQVLLHCVAAQSRTPTVGAAYSLLRGIPADRALPEVVAALPAVHTHRGFRDTLMRLAARFPA